MIILAFEGNLSHFCLKRKGLIFVSQSNINIMKKLVFLSSLLVFGLLTPSCRKGCTDETAKNFDSKAVKDDGSCEFEPIVQDSAEVILNVSYEVNGEPFALGASYQNAAGRTYKFDLAQLYLSNFVFSKLTSSSIELENYRTPEQYLLLQPTKKQYSLGNVLKGTVSGFNLIFGIDSSTNFTDPAIYDNGTALAYQNPNMHWSWSTGYIFMKLEGKTDTADVYTGSFDDLFTYHIGMITNSIPIELSYNGTLVGGEQYLLNLTVDFGKFIDDLDFTTEYVSHSTGTEAPLGAKIAEKAPQAIFITN